MQVEIVDPPAYTPPYDRSLSAALARAGAEVELVTSRFAHGEVPAPEGYRVRESFYRLASRDGLGDRGRRATRPARHLPGVLRLRRVVADAAVVHYQGLTGPGLDWALLG